MRRLCVLVICACDGNPSPPDAEMPALEQVALVPITPNRDVDMLFVIDDSPGTLDKQNALKAAFPAFLDTLDGLASLHIGVVTSDLGTSAADGTTGPNIGSGPGSCSGTGKDGRLVTNGSPALIGTFIVDTANADGSRTTNYTGTLAEAFAHIVSVGSSGCGFEQPLEAARRALDNHPANSGFLRANANLAIILLADEDDCSLATPHLLSSDTATLGPLQSFRCTQFGITCDEPIDSVGVKTNCRSNETSPYVTAAAPYATFFKALKPSAHQLYVASLTGPRAPVEVALRTPPGGGTPILALSNACQLDGPADPAVRILEHASTFPRHTFTSFCTADLTESARQLARNIRSMTGDTCLTEDIAMPAECTVTEQRGSSTTPIPPCTTSTTPCYELVADPSCTTTQQLRIEIARDVAPMPDAWIEVRCRL